MWGSDSHVLEAFRSRISGVWNRARARSDQTKWIKRQQRRTTKTSPSFDENSTKDTVKTWDSLRADGFCHFDEPNCGEIGVREHRAIPFEVANRKSTETRSHQNDQNILWDLASPQTDILFPSHWGQWVVSAGTRKQSVNSCRQPSLCLLAVALCAVHCMLCFAFAFLRS